MKKAILASVLGIAFSGLAAFGQGGAIFFSNYTGPVYNPVVYGAFWPAGQAEQNVNDPGVQLQLFYAYGTYTDVAAFMADALPGVTTAINISINQDGALGTIKSIGSPGGYYIGPTQVLPDWVPGETVTFMVEGWETIGSLGGPTYDSSMLRGTTELWTETEAASPNDYGIQPYPLNVPGNFAAGPPVLVLEVLIPEPATLALAGMGLLTMLTISRCYGHKPLRDSKTR